MNPLFYIICNWYERASSSDVARAAAFWTAVVVLLAVVLPTKGAQVVGVCGGFCCLVLWCSYPLKRREERLEAESRDARGRDRAA